jgi:hypothetical protein
MKRLIILILLGSIVFADDIFLKDGGYYKNVAIAIETPQGLVINFEGKRIQVSSAHILMIDRKPVDPDVPSQISDKERKITRDIGHQYSKSNVSLDMNIDLKMIPVTILSLYFAYQKFSQLDDIENANRQMIDLIELSGGQSSIDVDDGKGPVIRDGLFFLGLGLYSAWLGVEFVPIVASSDSLYIKDS